VEKLAEKYGFEKISFSTTWTANAFPRLLAKIGYRCAVATYGLGNMGESYVLPYIRGERFKGIGRWVGDAPDTLINKGTGFHTVMIGFNDKSDILARIKLFDLWDVPEYLVVVGQLKNKPHIESEIFYN
jgi:hypothetical protein